LFMVVLVISTHKSFGYGIGVYITYSWLYWCNSVIDVLIVILNRCSFAYD